jgi:hypothetical protein
LLLDWGDPSTILRIAALVQWPLTPTWVQNEKATKTGTILHPRRVLNMMSEYLIKYCLGRSHTGASLNGSTPVWLAHGANQFEMTKAFKHLDLTLILHGRKVPLNTVYSTTSSTLPPKSLSCQTSSFSRTNACFKRKQLSKEWKPWRRTQALNNIAAKAMNHESLDQCFWFLGIIAIVGGNSPSALDCVNAG